MLARCTLSRFAVALGGLLLSPILALAQVADLSISKTDSSLTEIPGTSISYTIVVSNAGPDPDPAAVVTDMFPATLFGVAWTCTASVGSSCTPAGGGDISDSVNILSGGTLTYVVTATIMSSATGVLTNIASITPSVFDPDGSFNVAIDTDTLTPEANIGITKTDGAATEIPGTSISYMIVVSNPGPSDVPGAMVNDMFPAALTGVSWSCSASPGANCTGAGVGDIADTVDLPAGGSVTYLVNATISPSATGILSNTATITMPFGVTNTGSDTATDNDTLTAQADLIISKTDGVGSVTAGSMLTYTITVSNAGPSGAPSATVTDVFPASLTGVTWTCSAGGGASCSGVGAGNISDTVNLPVGGSLTYMVNATVDPCASGTIVNTATAAPGPGVADLNGASASDTNTAIGSTADLQINATVLSDPILVCNVESYIITITNAGPSCASAVTLTNVLPAGVTFFSASPGSPTCIDSSGTQTCNLGTLAPGSVTVVTISGTTDFSLKGSTISDSMSVTASTLDPNPSDNSRVVEVDVYDRDPYKVSMTGVPKLVTAGRPAQASFVIVLTSLCAAHITTSNIELTSVLPDGLTLVQSLPEPTTEAGGTLTYEYPVLFGTDSEKVVIKANVDTSTPPGTDLTHAVSMIDDLGQQATDSITISVRTAAVSTSTRGTLRLRIVAARRVRAGTSTKVRVSIDNLLREPATDVDLSLSLPDDVELVSADPVPAAINGSDLSWNFETFRRKQNLKLTVRVKSTAIPGAVQTMSGEVTDSLERTGTATRDIIVREP